MKRNRNMLICGIYLAFCLLTGFFPHYGPPQFRYTGSDPNVAVWNLGWPLATMIWDARNELQVGPIAYALFPLQASIFLAGYLLMRFQVRRKATGSAQA